MSKFTDYLAHLRSQGDTRSSDSVALAIGSSMSDEERNALAASDPDFAKEYDYAYRHVMAPSTGEQAWNSLKSGGHQLLGGLASFQSAAGQAIFGDTNNGEKGPMDLYADQKAQDAAAARGVISTSDIKDVRNVGDAVDYLTTGAAQNIPTMIPGMAAAAGTALVTKNPTLSQAALAAFVPSFAQNTGEIYKGLLDEGVKPGEAAAPALLGGAASGALDVPGQLIGLAPILSRMGVRIGVKPALLQARLVGKLSSSAFGRRLLDTAATGATGMLAEGVPEALQEAIGMTVEEIVTGKDLGTDEWESRMLNAGVQGAFLGGGMAGTGAAITSPSDALLSKAGRIRAFHDASAKAGVTAPGDPETQATSGDAANYPKDWGQSQAIAYAQAEAQAQVQAAAAEVQRINEERAAKAAEIKQDAVDEARVASIDALDEAYQIADDVLAGRTAKMQRTARDERSVGQAISEMAGMNELDPEDEARVAQIQQAHAAAQTEAQFPWLTPERREIAARIAEQRRLAVAGRYQAVGGVIDQMAEMNQLDPEDEARVAQMQQVEADRVAAQFAWLNPENRAQAAQAAAQSRAAAQSANAAPTPAPLPIVAATPEPISPPTPAASNPNQGVPDGLQEKGQEEVQGLLKPAPITPPVAAPAAPALSVPVASTPKLIVTPPEERVEIMQRVKAKNPYAAADAVGNVQRNGGLAVVLSNAAGEHIMRPVDGDGNVGMVSMSKGKPNATATGKYAAKIDKLEGDGWKVVDYLQVAAGKKFKVNYAPGEYEAAVANIETLGKKTGPVQKTTGVDIEATVASPDATPDAAAQEEIVQTMREFIALSKQTANPAAVKEAAVLQQSIAEKTGRVLNAAEAADALTKIEAAKVEPTASVAEATPAPAKLKKGEKPAVVEQVKLAAEVPTDAATAIEKRKDQTSIWYAKALNKAKEKGPQAMAKFYTDLTARLVLDTKYQAKALKIEGLTDEQIQIDAQRQARTILRLDGIDPKSIQRSLRSPGSFLTDPSMARTEMVRALNFLKSLGFDVAVFQQNLASELETIRNTGGAVLPQDKLVAITLANLTNPSAADIGSAYHEAAHPFLDGLNPAIYRDYQAAVSLMEDAFSGSPISTDLRILVSTPEAKLTAEQKALIKSASPEQLAAALNAASDPEEMALEQGVEYLAIRGYDAGTARTLLRQIIDAVKEFMYHVAYAIGKTVRGDSNVTKILAREYVAAMFRNALTRANEGTVRHQIMEWFGSTAWNRELKMDLVSNFDGAIHPGIWDINTGQMIRNYVSANTAEGVAENIRIAEANEKILRSMRETLAPKQLPAETTFAVQAPIKLPDGSFTKPWVQIDMGEQRSATAEQLTSEGYTVPDVSSLPRGNYTLEQAINALNQYASDPRDREFLGQMRDVQVVRDKEGRLLAPNGRTSKLNEYQWKQVRTRNFKEWFGDWQNDPKNASKVVDPETGEPMVVYHGTTRDFDSFDHSAKKTFPNERNTQGVFYFTSSARQAAEYGGTLLPAFVNTRKPFAQERTGEYLNDFDEPTRDALETMGRIQPVGLSFLMNEVRDVPSDTDSLLVRIRNGEGYHSVPSQDVIAVFSPTQIKSATGNLGTFDPKQPSILRSMRVTPSSTESAVDTAHWQIASANFEQRTYASLFAWLKPSLPTSMTIDSFLKDVVGLRKNQLPTAKVNAAYQDTATSIDPVTGKPANATKIDTTMDMDRLTSSAQQDRATVASLEALTNAQTAMGDIQSDEQKKYNRLEKKKADKGLNADEQKTMDELSSSLAVRKKILNDQEYGIHKAMGVLEMVLNAVRLNVPRFAHVRGAEYLVPTTADAKVEDLIKGRKKLKAIGLNGATASPDEIRAFMEDIEKVAAWVNNPANQKLGAIYNQMRQQYEDMVALNCNERTTKPYAFIKSSWFKSLPDSMRNMGLASARRIATRFFTKGQIDRQYAGHCDVLGHQWLLSQADAKIALGLGRFSSDEQFQKAYMTPALRILNDPITGNVKERLFAMMAARGIKVAPSAQTAFWNFIQKYKEIDTFIAQAHEQMGLKVKDSTLGIERRLVELGEVTASRRIDAMTLQMFAKMEGTNWAALKTGAPKDLAAAYDANPDAVSARLNPLFEDGVADDFVRPLALDSRAHFNFYSEGLGKTGPASVYHIRTAFNAAFHESFAGVKFVKSGSEIKIFPTVTDATRNSLLSQGYTEAKPGFDAVLFAETLHELQGGTPETVGQTVQAVMDSLALRYKKLANISTEISNGNAEGSVGTLPRQLMDAREAEDLPAAWIEFMPMDPSSLRHLFSQMSAAAAFGRDGLSASGETGREVLALRQELAALNYEYNKIKDAHSTTKAIRDEYQRRYGEDAAAMYQAAKGADSSLKFLTQFNKMVTTMVRERGTMADLNTPDRILSTISAWTIAAPRTAITTLLDAISPFHFFKFGPTTFRNLGVQVGKTIGSDMLVSAFRDIGMNLHLNADAALRRVNWNGGDPGSAISAQSRALDFGMGSEQQKAGNMARYVLRTMTEPLEWGVSDITGARKFGTMQTASPKIRFLSLFRAMQGTATNTAIDSMYETVSRMYLKAIEHIDQTGDVNATLRKLRTGFNPDGTAFELTAENVGMGVDKEAFAYLKETMASKIRRGTFERQVAEAYERNARGKPIADQMQAAGKPMEEIHAALRQANALLVDDDTYGGIANIATEEMALEPGMGADAPLFSHPVMRPLMPLLSFTIKSAQRFPKMFKDPAGQIGIRSALGGAATLALIAVPTTIAFSMLMDEFDEEVLGKKSDLRDPDTAMGALERLARYGVGGAYSEALNGVLNAQQGMRPFDPSSRIMAFAKFNQVYNLASNLVLANPPLDWANFGKPVTQIVGANNLIQYAQIANQMTGNAVAPTEAVLTRRTSVGNYLRAAGRNLNLDVRSYGGGKSRPTPVSPWVAAMERAALQGDSFAFDESYSKAILVSMEANDIDREEAKKRVRAAFQSRHPLRSIFKTAPTEKQYREILVDLGSDAPWVSNTVNEYNVYLKRLGLQAFDGTSKHSPALSAESIRRGILKEMGMTDMISARKMTSSLFDDE